MIIQIYGIGQNVTVWYCILININLLISHIYIIECFETENGTLTPTISKETKIFNDHFQKYNKCLHYVSENDICKMCLNNYTQLYNYYASISNENEKIGVCMDIVDLVYCSKY